MVSVLKENWRDLGEVIFNLCETNYLQPRRVFRSGRIDFCTWNDLGSPQTILNLRTEADQQSAEFVERAVAFVHVPAEDRTEIYDVRSKSTKEWLAALMNVFIRSKYPLLVHCRRGRDRTGMVCALLLMALDVPFEIIVKEFQYSLSPSDQDQMDLFQAAIKSLQFPKPSSKSWKAKDDCRESKTPSVLLQDYFKHLVNVQALRDKLLEVVSPNEAPSAQATLVERE